MIKKSGATFHTADNGTEWISIDDVSTADKIVTIGKFVITMIIIIVVVLGILALLTTVIPTGTNGDYNFTQNCHCNTQNGINIARMILTPTH